MQACAFFNSHVAVKIDEKCNSCQEDSMFMQCRTNKLCSLKSYDISNCIIRLVRGTREAPVALTMLLKRM